MSDYLLTDDERTTTLKVWQPVSDDIWYESQREWVSVLLRAQVAKLQAQGWKSGEQVAEQYGRADRAMSQVVEQARQDERRKLGEWLRTRAHHVIGDIYNVELLMEHIFNLNSGDSPEGK